VTPYYSDDWATIYHGDCRAVLPTIAVAGCTITDPPFSARTQRDARSNSSSATAGGRHLSGSKAAFAPFEEAGLREVFTEIGRVTSGWVVSSTDYRHAVALEAEPPEGLRVLRVGVWVKTNPMPIITADRPGQGWEAFVAMYPADKKPKWNGGGRSINYIGPTSQGSGHPTQKPLPMISQWVSMFSDPGDTVLDPFAGSGTSLLAAKNLGRKAIGVEIEERYCELAARRLSQGVLDLGDATRARCRGGTPGQTPPNEGDDPFDTMRHGTMCERQYAPGATCNCGADTTEGSDG
jgi:site-specific DNA-methyltransferase (adenine-specific)